MFDDHPMQPNKDPNFVEARDLLPGYPNLKQPSPFALMESDPKEFPIELSQPTTQSVIKTGPSNLTKNDLSLRKHVRRHQCDEPMLRDFEFEITAFLKRLINKEEDYEMDMTVSDIDSVSDDEGWISLMSTDPDRKHQLLIKINNSFLRLLVHSMCRYYCLTSTSVNEGGERITIIEAPLSIVTKSYTFPPCSFSDFFFE
ncbi:hypothetical protein BC833DRAFT_593783 [Globomyces pollinis-pini]|nr:hypothetical protein BC833DRAFT_593783 [Globomyces pollinis-pini]